MPIITSSSYRAPLWVPGKHAETILPSLFRYVEDIPFIRERIATHDGDFLDIDWSCQNSENLVILAHGVEGHSRRPYIKGMSKEFLSKGWDVLAWNFRGCSGEINRKARLYHAGCSDDLSTVINHALKTKRYKKIVLIGFSIGGSVILKYLGESADSLPSEIACAIGFSVPCDLHSCVHMLSLGFSRIYVGHLLRTLKQKVIEKAKAFPELLNGIDLSRVKTFYDFDDCYTAPVHGFRDAEHYYDECSTRKNISQIKVPTLIVNAQNDPFMGPTCFPVEECQSSEFVYLETPKDGGHIGFMNMTLTGKFWTEERAMQFLQETI